MPFFYGYHFDPTYILVLIGAVLSIIASARVNSTFNKYARVRSMSGMTGAQTAEAILRSRGIYDVQVEHIRGNLTDHYDPSKKVVRLSDSVYNATSVAAIGVAAHECSTTRSMRRSASGQGLSRRQISVRSSGFRS